MIITLHAGVPLRADLKLIMQTAAQAANAWMYAQFEAPNPQALTAARTAWRAGAAVPRCVLNELRRLSQAVMDGEARGDANFKRVHAAYEGFRHRAVSWAAVPDEAYARAGSIAGHRICDRRAAALS